MSAAQSLRLSWLHLPALRKGCKGCSRRTRLNAAANRLGLRAVLRAKTPENSVHLATTPSCWRCEAFGERTMCVSDWVPKRLRRPSSPRTTSTSPCSEAGSTRSKCGGMFDRCASAEDHGLCGTSAVFPCPFNERTVACSLTPVPTSEISHGHSDDATTAEGSDTDISSLPSIDDDEVAFDARTLPFVGSNGETTWLAPIPEMRVAF